MSYANTLSFAKRDLKAFALGKLLSGIGGRINRVDRVRRWTMMADPYRRGEHVLAYTSSLYSPYSLYSGANLPPTC
jgi:hypothetical protein